MPQRKDASPSITRASLTRGASRHRGKTLHVDAPGHHVLGHRRTGVAVYGYARLLVHAGGVVTSMAMDVDVDRCVHAHGNAVGAVRVVHRNRQRPHWQPTMQVLIQSAQGLLREIEIHARHMYICSGLGSKMLAFFTPGSFASERNSEEIAT